MFHQLPGKLIRLVVSSELRESVERQKSRIFAAEGECALLLPDSHRIWVIPRRRGFDIKGREWCSGRIIYRVGRHVDGRTLDPRRGDGFDSRNRSIHEHVPGSGQCHWEWRRHACHRAFRKRTRRPHVTRGTRITYYFENSLGRTPKTRIAQIKDSREI